MRRVKDILIFILITMIAVAGLSIMYLDNAVNVNAGTVLKRPRIVDNADMNSKQVVTWDCVWLGRYPQTEIVSSAKQCGTYDKTFGESNDYEVDGNLYTHLLNASYDNNADTVINGIKYHRMHKGMSTYRHLSESDYYYNWLDDNITYHYFRYEPIKWRVLSISDGKILLLSDQILDDQRYNEKRVDITWEKSTIRSWLNGYGTSQNLYGVDYSNDNFINKAFTLDEQENISSVSLKNSNNISMNTAGGNDTQDKIFLLSEADVYSTDEALDNGFILSRSEDEGRKCKASTFAKAMGVNISENKSSQWWLRSPGSFNSTYAASVSSSGFVSSDVIHQANIGIRPALYIRASSSDIYTYAGTVSSDGTEKETNGKKNYTVSYDANGGSGAPASQKGIVFGESPIFQCTLSRIIPVKEGYIFSGWSTSNSATIASYDSGEKIDVKSDITLYAVWERDGSEITQININDCSIINESNISYTGLPLKPEVEVKHDNKTLIVDKDYSLEYKNNTEVGNGIITIVGMGDYYGSKDILFKIIPINPVLKFELSEITKTTDDNKFVNSLVVKTDGEITYSSDNLSVAIVNSNTGEVTIKGAGIAVIHANAATGKNYLAGETSYILKVNEKQKQDLLSLENLSYSFGNTASSFQYPDKYNYPYNIYEMIFGKTTKAAFWFDRDVEITGGIWRGNCAGFSGTSALLMDSSSGISIKDFDASVNSIGQLNPKSKSSTKQMDITAFIESMQIAQHTQLFNNEISKNRIYTSKHLNKHLKNLNGLYNTIREESEEGRPTLLALYQNGAHAVLAYGVKEISDKESKILLYDSNWPKKERALTIKKDDNGNYTEWSYEIGGSYGTWGTTAKSSSISYVPYSIIKEIWMTKGHLKENENVLAINSGSVAIYTKGDKPVATVTQGELSTTIDDIQVIDFLSLEKADSDTLLLSVPVDVYTFENLDKSVNKFNVSMTNTNLGASAVTTADSVTMAVDDSCNLNAVFIDAGKDDDYSITLNSSFSSDEDNVVVSGKGNGEKMEVSQIKGNININNCQITSISIAGKEINKYRIDASADIGGTISPAGESVVTAGQNITYKIKADDGYRISDVIIDGRSVGAVSTYMFDDIGENHTIRAEFKKKASNQILARNYVLNSSNQVKNFYIKAYAKGNAHLSYISNNSLVKVTSNGKITIMKNFVGRAAIQIKSSSTEYYTETSKTITITVNPMTTIIKSLKKNGSGKMTVTWKNSNSVTGYQISYAVVSNFKNAKTVTINNKKAGKTILKKLNKKKKYYVRIRTFKTVGHKKYYSVWSKAKKR